MGKSIIIPGADFSSVAVGLTIAAPNITISGSTATITAESGATIRYTLDGSAPTASTGTVYSNAITLNNSCTIKAIAVKEGFASDVTTKDYVVVATPVISYDVIAGRATITADSGAEIRYTLDGGTPTANSTLYSGAIYIPSAKTVKAIAIKSGYTSIVQTQTCTPRAITEDDFVQNHLRYAVNNSNAKRMYIPLRILDRTNWQVKMQQKSDNTVKFSCSVYALQPSAWEAVSKDSVSPTTGFNTSFQYDSGWIYSAYGEKTYNNTDWNLDADGKNCNSMALCFVYNDANNDNFPTLAEIIEHNDIELTGLAIDFD